MGEYFARDYTGAPFQMFDTVHLITLGLIVLLNLIFTVVWRNPGEKARRNVRYTLAALLVLNETGYHIWNVATGLWSIQTMLPFHVCAVLVWLTPVMLVTGNKTIYELSYFLGIGGAMQALLTPDVGIYGFPHYRYFAAFISHTLLFTAPIYMTVVEGYRPTWKSLLRLVVILNIYMAFVMGVNALIGSNYMFIARKPDDPSLIDVLGPWHILSLELVGLAICFILYLPFAIKDWRAKRTQRKSEAGSPVP